MQTGISTASLFGRCYTEEAVKMLNELNVQTTEIFLESYSEYTRKFGKKLKRLKGDIDVHSIHTLTTQFEPQLYSLNDRARAESMQLLKGTVSAGKEVGAKYYTFHGVARIKRTPMTIDFDRIGRITNDIIGVCKEHGMCLAYENVHWAYYNYIGFFKELKKRVPELKGTLDIKQARQSGIDYKEYLNEMGKDIVTVHLSDVNEEDKMCLPGKGITNFDELFVLLKSVGFDGSLILEVYKNDFENISDLMQSYNFIKEKAEKYF